MSWMRLQFTPGINKERTRYAAAGTWVDGNLVRFREGYPEMWGGWVRAFPSLTMYGVCRSMHRFSDLTGYQWMGIGTSKRFYIIADDTTYDVTPALPAVTLTANPLATVSGSSALTVTHVNHGRLPGDTVILSGATAVGGFTASVLNTSFLVSAFVDNDHYQIEMPSAATSTATGGGASVKVQYLFNAGSDDQIYGGGWGASGYGVSQYGGDPTQGLADHMGVWSQDNWGEDLVANAQRGPIFYWNAKTPTARMVNIRDLTSADGNAPAVSEFIVVSHRDRHLLAFGATEFGNPSGAVAPMTVRWCSQENILDWNEASTSGTAGSLPLSRGSRLIAAQATQQEIVVWSDQSIYSLRYIGAPYIYGADVISDFSDILGLKAATVCDSSVFWMGRGGLYVYDGRVKKLPCSVWDYVSKHINFEQATKTFCASNMMHNEVLWFYPSLEGSGEPDSYIAYNFKENLFSIGKLDRTAWLDLDSLNAPIAASPDRHLYRHETGADDGSQDPPVPLAAYIESGPIELSSEGAFDKGDRMMFVRRILPDVTFRDFDDEVNVPKVNLVLKMMDKPGGGWGENSSSQVGRTAILPVEKFTDDLFVRLRGRSLTFRIDSPALGTQWRVGVPRVDVRTDGQR